jgi:DNA-binding transcriptional LysR family regulator
MDELAAMRVFTRVAQKGSFSKVARFTGTSTSSTARLVNSLEEELGVRLFNRTTRQLVLTEAGQRFYEDAARILQSVDDAKRGAAAYQHEVRGLIRVHCGKSAGSAIILPALPQFLAQNPDVIVDLSLTDERVDIVAEKVDIAIWRGSMEDSSLVARLLGSPRRVLCGSPKYFSRHPKPSAPADLAKHNCLLYSAPHYTGEWIFCKDGQTIRVPVSGNLKTDTGAALLTSTLSGLGLAVLPEWMVADFCKQGQLQTVLTDYEVRPSDTDASLYLVYPHRSPPPKVASFIQFVLALFGRQGKSRSP